MKTQTNPQLLYTFRLKANLVLAMHGVARMRKSQSYQPGLREGPLLIAVSTICLTIFVNSSLQWAVDQAQVRNQLWPEHLLDSEHVRDGTLLCPQNEETYDRPLPLSYPYSRLTDVSPLNECGLDMNL